MARGEQFHMDHHYFDGGEFGPKDVPGYKYEGRFGPLWLASSQDQVAAVLRGSHVGEGRLEWGPESESTLEDAVEFLQQEGITGNVGGKRVRIWWQHGVRRSQRFIRVEMQDRPPRIVRLRRWKTWSLEVADKTPLMTLKHSWRWAWRFGSWGWKGQVLASADKNDVAVLTLLCTAGVTDKIDTGGPPFLGF